ncbi:GNAT family N-acetyltransferase [Candidatus Woesearchaeota archaeon]|nr:GNAT family N-acetyltransferase [Candidatus Woesearchaeota archaeon]
MDLTLIKIRRTTWQEFHKDFNPEETKIILKNNRRIGYYALKNKSDHYYIDNVQISPSMKGKGIGTHILKLIEKQVLKTKTKVIKLEVFKDNPAKKLYERFNYKLIKDKKTSILMEKKI